METVQIVYYALLGLMVLAGFFGFLFGMGRGFSKATLRLLFFIFFAIVAVVITPYISSFMLEMPISYDGMNGSFAEIMNEALATDPMVQNIVASSELLQDFIDKAPLLIINLFVYVGMLLTLNGIGLIVYAVFAGIFFRKSKEYKIPKNDKLHVQLKAHKQNKHRLFGGLVGAAHSILFVTLLLLPLTGFLSIATNVYGSTTGNVAYASESVELTPTAQLIDDNLPQEARELIEVYTNSPLAYVSKYTGADSFIFDSLTTIKLKDQNNQTMYISYRSEIYSIAKIYDNIEFLMDLEYENLDFTTLDYDKLDTAINAVLDSRLLSTVAPELLDWAVTDLNRPVNERYIDAEIDEEYIAIVNEVVDGYEEAGGIYNGIRQDLDTVFNVFRTLGESGIINEATQTEVDLDAIKTIALANDRAVVSSVIGNLFEAISLRTLGVGLLNEQIQALEESQDVLSGTYIEFSEIDYTQIDWTDITSEFRTIVNNFIDIYENFEEDFTTNIVDVVENNPYELLNLDTDVLTGKLANIMSALQNTDLLVDENGNKVLYGQFMDYLNTTELSEYVDFVSFKAPNAWANEMLTLNSLLTTVKDSGVLTTLTDNNFDFNALDINAVIDMISAQADNNQTYVHNFIEPVLDSLAFRKILQVGFGYVNDFVIDNQETLGAGTVLGKVQSNQIFNNNEKVYILAFFDNVVLFASEVDIDAVQADPFNTLMQSNLTRLGLALDSIKDSALFGEYTEDGVDYNGVYAEVMQALANNASYGEFADFTVTTEETFSWNTEFSLVQTAITEMNNIIINYDGVDKTLVQAIVDGEDLTVIIENLTDNNVDNLIGPLVSSQLLSKNVVMIVNVMNEQIGGIVSTPIAQVDSNIDLTAQEEEITTIIKSIINIYPSISAGIDANAIQTLSVDIGALLNTIKSNAYRPAGDGVFENTYSAVIDYIKADATFGGTLTYILDSYIDQADVNWQDLLGLAVDANDLGSTTYITPSLSTKLENIMEDMFQDTVYGDITGDIVDISNDFINISGTSTEDDIIGYTSDAFGTLADGQDAYVLAGQGGALTDEQLKAEYASKVDDILNFFKGLTGITQFDSLIGLTDYRAEQTALTNLSSALDVLDGTPTQDDYEDVVDALVESEFIMEMLEDNAVDIDLDPAVEATIEDYIDNTFSDPETVATLKEILGLL